MSSNFVDFMNIVVLYSTIYTLNKPTAIQNQSN